jgi:hypothetical protein
VVTSWFVDIIGEPSARGGAREHGAEARWALDPQRLAGVSRAAHADRIGLDEVRELSRWRIRRHDRARNDSALHAFTRQPPFAHGECGHLGGRKGPATVAALTGAAGMAAAGSARAAHLRSRCARIQSRKRAFLLA